MSEEKKAPPSSKAEFEQFDKLFKSVVSASNLTVRKRMEQEKRKRGRATGSRK